MAVDRTYHVTSEEVGATILAYTQAYNATGNRAYLDAAQRAALCLRRMQRGDLKTTNFSATASAGTARRRLGWWTHSMDIVFGSGGGGEFS